jgi:uncharacterized protein (TIGR02145 family)
MTLKNFIKTNLVLSSGILFFNCGGGSHSTENTTISDTTKTNAPIVDSVKPMISSYQSVMINDLDWMTQDLDVVVFKNGDTISQVSSDSEWTNAGKEGKPAWCYYNNDKKNGKLYNFHAVNDPRGLAPEGWRIPNNKEFEDLIDHLGGLKLAGGKLKSTEGWGEKGKGTNETGFNAKPTGMRNHIGEFSNQESFGYWWSSSDRAKENAWHISLNNNNPQIKDYFSQQSNGFSVRCVKNK